MLKTSYAGDVTIDWGEVSRITTKRPIEVTTLGDEKTVKGELIASPEDRVIAVKPDRASATAIFAIDKIERLKPVKEEGWEFTGHLNLGINIESGNTEKQYFHFDADTQIANGPHQIKLFAETTVETNNDVRTDDKQLFNGSYNYFLTKKWFLRTNTMRVLLFWKLFANFQYNFNYNNEPADGKVSNDAKFVTTVGLKW